MSLIQYMLSEYPIQILIFSMFSGNITTGVEG